jgi:putative addiction module antidote
MSFRLGNGLPSATRVDKASHRRYNVRMNMALKIKKIGNSAGVILPKELLARLRVSPGDMVFVTESPDGLRITANDPSFAEKMALAEQIMREDRDILRVLAQ